METTLLIIIIVVTAIFLVFLACFIIWWRFENIFRQWREAELQLWQVEKERAQREAVSQSRAVLGGKFTEQLAPYLPEFRYDPTEARFIGSPIDLIVFPGLASGNPQEIVIMEIKSGKNRQLSPQERKIRQLIEDGMVRWELIERPSQV
jgi:predicted Holliday junction resolvase-like endonuclease|tara:strand:- start:659 stop:1105 length:447 start_codon:yes stop_codon:yes gene_type:complete